MEKDHDKDIFMLVDGSAIVHRAYHALPNFSKTDGTPTGAVHGFFQMVFKMMGQLHPKHIAIAFDRPKPTFRQQLYAGYQSQRPKMESELSSQFNMIQQILSASHIATYAVDGYEADDIIGTLTFEAKKRDGVVYIITGDRDLLQLVDKNVKVMTPVKGISEVMIFDADKVREKYGISPEYFIDLKALMGDASDNYPGVSGIGPKTASNLINAYGSLDEIYQRLGDIALEKKSLAEKLTKDADKAELARRLATILIDVPFSHNFSDMEVKKIDVDSFKQILEELEFKTLPKRVDEVFDREGGFKEAKSQMKLL